MGDREGEEADRGCNEQITSTATGAHSPWGLQRDHPRHPVRGAETSVSHWLHSDPSDADCPALPWGKSQQPEEASRKGHRGCLRSA